MLISPKTTFLTSQNARHRIKSSKRHKAKSAAAARVYQARLGDIVSGNARWATRTRIGATWRRHWLFGKAITPSTYISIKNGSPVNVQHNIMRAASSHHAPVEATLYSHLVVGRMRYHDEKHFSAR